MNKSDHLYKRGEQQNTKKENSKHTLHQHPQTKQKRNRFFLHTEKVLK